MKSPSNLKKVFSSFEKNYQNIPLEIFGHNPYKTLISTLMSARTNDDTTLASSLRLFKVAPNIKALDRLELKKIEKFIYPVGFYKTKAKHIKKLTKIILQEHKGVIPQTREELMQLPGVGRKTANLVLNRAFNIPAIAVDTHVHKISNLIGWVKTNSPEDTEKKLNELIPKRYWSKMNKLFVSIGRQYKSKKKLIGYLESEGLI